MVITSAIAPADYGRFFFCQAVVVIAGLFFDFGAYAAGSRLLALARDKQVQRQTLGALVLIAAGLGVLFAFFVAAAAVPIEIIFKQDVRWVLLMASPLAFFQPFQLLVEVSCQGLNRIRLLSVVQLLMSGSNLSILAALALLGRLTPETALASFLAGIGIGSTIALLRLRPAFAGAGSHLRILLRELKSYGFNMYLARVTATGSTRLDAPIITFLLGREGSDLAPLGLYGLAQKLGNPISTLSRVVGVSRFRAFASLRAIPARISKWNAVALTGLAAGLIIAGPFVVNLVFSKYSGAAALLAPVAFLNLFAGLYQPYNAFLSSHGRGAELRNIAIAFTIANTGGVIIGVLAFGVLGAAWASAGAMALDYLLHLYYYRRFQKTREETA